MKISRKKSLVLSLASIEKLKPLKYHIFQKQTKLVISIICSKCKNEDEKIVQEEESDEVIKIIGLIKMHNYLKNMENETQAQTLDYKNWSNKKQFLEEIKYNELISKELKKTCETLMYVEQFLIQASTFTGYVSISAFASVVCISVRTASSAVGLKVFVITIVIENNSE